MPDLVDVIFLDIDGVLLPFGGDREGEGLSFAEGCLFPDRAMRALTALLRRMRDASFETTLPAENDASRRPTIRGNPALVLSSTWRARPEFVRDILSSFRAYARENGSGDGGASGTWENHHGSFFDVVDPHFHATRHDEIYKWVDGNVRGGERTASSRPDVAAGKCVVRSWIALDDEDIVNVEGGVSRDAMEHAVRTESSVGLTSRDVDAGVVLAKKQIRKFHGISS